MKEKVELEILRKGTVKCPICKQPLHFNNIGGMRIVEEISNVMVYDAKCPSDNKYFYIKADSQK